VSSQPEAGDEDDLGNRLPPWLATMEESGLTRGRLALSLNIPASPSSHRSREYAASGLRYLVSPPASPVYDMEKQVKLSSANVVV
jgi:hypothetical protein